MNSVQICTIPIDIFVDAINKEEAVLCCFLFLLLAVHVVLSCMIYPKFTDNDYYLNN